jgi:hypothetical protein
VFEYECTMLVLCISWQNTEGGDTDSEDEAYRLDEIESCLRIYDPQFKRFAVGSHFRNKLLCKLQPYLSTAELLDHEITD